MLDNYTEFSIPYDKIIPVLQKGGYDGYIASEYEGNRHIQDVQEVDSVEQVRRHQIMLRNLGVGDGPSVRWKRKLLCPNLLRQQIQPHLQTDHKSRNPKSEIPKPCLKNI